MRDLIVSAVLLGLLPVSYRQPYVGLLVFSWLAYMRPQDLTWGFAKGMRWSFYVAAVMFAGYFAKPRRRFFVPDLRTYLFAAMALAVAIGIALGDEITARQISRYIEFVKILIISLFTATLVTSKERLRGLMWVVALSLGFYGVKNGVAGVISLGRMQVLRGPGGMLLDNNDLSLALAMAVPMLFHLGWTERSEKMRRAFWVAVPLTVMTVGLTRSRGGFLSVAAAIFVLVWRSRRRVFGLAACAMFGLVALIAAPSEYKERLVTIVEYQTEGSALSRLRAWGIATRMALDNPFFGVGFGRFGRNFVRYALDPTPAEVAGRDIIVAHNSYLQIWAECGTIAISLYLCLVAISFLTIWKVRRMARKRYDSSWILNYATMFESALVAFVVGSTFLNRAHFDLFYHFVAIIMVFGYVSLREMRNEGVHMTAAGGGRAPLRLAHEHGFERKSVRARLAGGFGGGEA